MSVSLLTTHKVHITNQELLKDTRSDLNDPRAVVLAYFFYHVTYERSYSACLLNFQSSV